MQCSDRDLEKIRQLVALRRDWYLVLQVERMQATPFLLSASLTGEMGWCLFVEAVAAVSETVQVVISGNLKRHFDVLSANE
jgi:hypothetical protein